MSALLVGTSCSNRCSVSGKNSIAVDTDTNSAGCIARIGFDCITEFTTDYTNCSCSVSCIVAGALIFSLLCRKSHSN